MNKYSMTDMYTGCFAYFETNEERWAYWSRWAWINRYEEIPTPLSVTWHNTLITQYRRLSMAKFHTMPAAAAFCSLYLTPKTRQHNDRVFRAFCDAGSAANTFFRINIGFHNSSHSVISHAAPQHGYIALTSHNYYFPYTKRVQSIFMGSAPAAFCPPYRTFLFSAPGVVTITFSGVITSAPFAVAAPLNIFSTMALNVSTTAPSVTYSAMPLIW